MADNSVNKCSKLCVATEPLHKGNPFKTLKTVASDGTNANHLPSLRTVKSLDSVIHVDVHIGQIYTNIYI